MNKIKCVQVGLKLAAKAGFNIERAPQVWDDFARAQGPGAGALAILNTHPASESRKKSLMEEIESMKQRGWSKGYGIGSAIEQFGATKNGYFAV